MECVEYETLGNTYPTECAETMSLLYRVLLWKNELEK